MNTYAVRFLKGTDIEVAYVQGESQSEAKKEFSKIYPDIDSGKILSTENIQEQSTDYGTSIAVAKIIEFIGWIAVVAGVGFTVLLVLEGDMALLGVPSSVTVALIGLMLVLAGQASRALFDNANYSKQMLDEMRNSK